VADEEVLYTKEKDIAVITINRPDRMNAVSWAMQDLINSALDEARRDDEVRALILTGAGRAFCAGTDLSGGMALSAEGGSAQHGPATTDARRSGWIFTNLAKPTVAAVNGAAVGMGAEFTIQCDVRVASERARFGWIFPQRGIVPDTGAGTYLLPRIVGISHAAELLFSGEIIDAQEALRIGLVSKVVPHEELMDAAMAMATRLSRGAPLAIRWAKQLMYRGFERDVETHQEFNRQLLAQCFTTEDHKEGVQAFLEKREARFKGR